MSRMDHLSNMLCASMLSFSWSNKVGSLSLHGSISTSVHRIPFSIRNCDNSKCPFEEARNKRLAELMSAPAHNNIFAMPELSKSAGIPPIHWRRAAFCHYDCEIKVGQTNIMVSYLSFIVHRVLLIHKRLQSTCVVGLNENGALSHKKLLPLSRKAQIHAARTKSCSHWCFQKWR